MKHTKHKLTEKDMKLFINFLDHFQRNHIDNFLDDASVEAQRKIDPEKLDDLLLKIWENLTGYYKK